MGAVGKWLLRALSVIFGLSALFSLIGALTADEFHPPLVLLPALTGAMALGLWRWSGAAERRAGDASKNFDRWSEETAAFLARVNEAGAFPIAVGSRMISTDERPVLLSSQATLLELQTTRSSQHVGTRLMLGGVPIYLGKSAPVSRTEMADAGGGELAITPERLIFSGDARTADVQLSRVAAVDLCADGFSLTVTGRARPMFLRVENPLLWTQVLKNVAQLQLRGRVLPEGARLQVL